MKLQQKFPLFKYLLPLNLFQETRKVYCMALEHANIYEMQ